MLCHTPPPPTLASAPSPSRLPCEGGREGEREVGRSRRLPLPMEGASPFMKLRKGLPGDEGTSRELPPCRSISPACSRSRPRSRDSRLNCSLCARHFSSSSRALRCARRPGPAVSRRPGLLGPRVSAHRCASVRVCARVCTRMHATCAWGDDSACACVLCACVLHGCAQD